MESLTEEDRQDIQGLLVRGYGHLPCARFCLMTIENGELARAFFAKHADNTLTYANKKPAHQAVNCALTASGLGALGLPHKLLAQWSDPFRAGMVTDHKSRILADHSHSAPSQWLWGGPVTAPVHALLLIYAETEEKLEALVSQLVTDAVACGLSLLSQLRSCFLPGQKEHFGFRDGIAQPYVPAFDQSGRGEGKPQVALGEFVLGYSNGYGRVTQRPLVNELDNAARLLPADLSGSGKKDLGRNGSYLVFRQLAQNVALFWETLLEYAPAVETQIPVGGSSAERQRLAAITLGSKMVGRWPNGVPLIKAGTWPEALTYASQFPNLLDQFAYHREDAAGHRCPLGAHIRRAQPRDMLNPEPGTQKSVDFTNRHRLLRRGRSYGAPFNPALNIDDFLKDIQSGKASSESERGLHFMCLGANIQRQFEFVQYSWCTNPNFNGLYDDPDPIMGDRRPHGRTQDSFTIQHPLVNQQVRGLPDFVVTRGGAYFFMPGKRALKYMLEVSR